MKPTISFLLLASCAGGPAGPMPSAGTTPGQAGVPGPQPGADLTGPVPAPARAERGKDGKAIEPLDLGADRPVVRVDLPQAPRGAAAPFTFGDERRGWVTKIPERNQLPSVAYGDGRVYVSAGFESVAFYALDAETGRFSWSSRQLEDNGPTAPIYYQDGENGKVIFNTESCTLFVMDAKTGKKLWYKYLGDPTLAQAAVSEGLIYAQHPGNGGPTMSAYRVKDGSVAWSKRIDGEPLAAPVVHGDALYFSTIGGRLYRFDKKTGKKRWEQKLNATSTPWVEAEELHLTRREGGKEVQIVVAAADGRVLRAGTAVDAKYIGDVPRNLGNWKQVWAFEGSRPVIAGGVRYAAMGGRIEATDPQSGAPLWIRHHKKGLRDRSVGTVALAGPQVVVSTRDGQIFGLDVDTGYTLWAYDLGKSVVAQPVIARGWVYATTTDGEVIALNVADKTLDGWHMWGGNPQHNGPVR